MAAGHRDRSALRIASGVLVWALHFTALYGFTSLACARDFAGAVPGMVAAATAVAAALALALIVRGWRNRAVFIDWMTAAVAGAALIAILCEAVAAWLVPLCAPS